MGEKVFLIKSRMRFLVLVTGNLFGADTVSPCLSPSCMITVVLWYRFDLAAVVFGRTVMGKPVEFSLQN